MNLNEEPWFDVIPWGVMAVSSYIAGWISDYLKKAGYSLLFDHKLMQVSLINSSCFCISFNSLYLFEFLFLVVVNRFYRTRISTTLLNLCQDSKICIFTSYYCYKLNSFYPSWIIPSYTSKDLLSSFCNITSNYLN